jgi:CDP-diacylglycerol--glycerol-3-phosphate 3-phosphatidyltransferase
MLKNKLFTISNQISFLRLLLSIPFWFLLNNFDQSSARYAAAALALFAAFTDILDGYLARKLNQVTEYGKIIDPLADKVIIGVIVLKLFLIGEIPSLYFVLIVGRDLLILIGGLIISKKTGIVIPSNWLGKLTVVIVSFVLLMIMLNVSRDLIYFNILYHLSILLLFVSFVNYFFKALKKIKESK